MATVPAASTSSIVKAVDFFHVDCADPPVHRETELLRGPRRADVAITLKRIYVFSRRIPPAHPDQGSQPRLVSDPLALEGRDERGVAGEAAAP
jgi:hypothetical protein